VAGSYYEPIADKSSLPSPAFGQPPADIAQLFPHRYAGLSYSRLARELRVGAALRIGDSLAAGVAVSARRIELAETRTLWAGFSGRDGLANPALDTKLRIDGADGFAPGGTLGLLFAPLEIPIELAASAGYTRGARAKADALVVATQPGGPGAGSDSGTARISMPDAWIIAAGARVVQNRLAIEVGTIARLLDGNRSPSWRVRGIELTDVSGLVASVGDVPSQWRGQRQLVGLGSVDVEVLSGFLWLTAGYRFRQASSENRDMAPTTADLASHSAAIGAEVYVGGITATVGYSRSFSRAQEVRASNNMLINPFDGGTARTGLGTYDRSDDRVGISLEVSFADDELEPIR